MDSVSPKKKLPINEDDSLEQAAAFEDDDKTKRAKTPENLPELDAKYRETGIHRI